MLLLLQIILENRPICRGDGERDYVSVKLVPLDSAVLPES